VNGGYETRDLDEFHVLKLRTIVLFFQLDQFVPNWSVFILNLVKIIITTNLFFESNIFGSVVCHSKGANSVFKMIQI
jgi:hypothetical protein